jgi:hypothetical protein
VAEVLDTDEDRDRMPDRCDPRRPAVDAMVASALLGLDLEAAPGHRPPAEPLPTLTVHRQELAASKRENRSTLNEIAATLGVSRFTANAMFEEPVPQGVGRRSRKAGSHGARHTHGVGRRRRHAGAGRR